jgi:hypothetical protein
LATQLCPSFRREWNARQNLRGKAFRFGIFWNRIRIAKTAIAIDW